jgi:hypothetical protein
MMAFTFSGRWRGRVVGAGAERFKGRKSFSDKRFASSTTLRCAIWSAIGRCLFRTSCGRTSQPRSRHMVSSAGFVYAQTSEGRWPAAVEGAVWVTEFPISAVKRVNI